MYWYVLCEVYLVEGWVYVCDEVVVLWVVVIVDVV